tara:strand:+ start:216 stop:1172 length:957 start_codon:yes stop_codon:yes gene_type:complete
MQEHETWQVLDATKIQTYMRCPRKFFYNYVLGWKSEIPSNHLVFGSAWHMAMEVLLDKGYTAESCAEGYKIAENHIREFFPPEWDNGNAPKTPANIFRSLPMYCKTYQEDDFKVEHIEVAGSVAIGPGKLLHFKTDAICKDHRGIFSLEHKTGSRFSNSWGAQWRQKMQIGVYSHVLYCMYPENEVYGVIINGTFFANEPKRKKDGELYAGARDTEFRRVPCRRTLQAMEAWLVETEEIYDRIQNDYNRLSEATEDESILKAFPRNTESCSDYGQCPFLDYCSVWNNPLQHCGEPPVGMEVDHWDPRKADTIREVVEL